ncbi:MAG: TIGR04283 family arsenosugar biosynthesis glycosyltransferase [Proteobacteria bacterium]|nr:TIGR04283 family arsenosugar biosynthesis glycosyltransferase [Pseudomonadota bacterium]
MISVIIPTLNEELCIEDTIHPARDGGDVEIIIADGGSNDSTTTIVQHFADKIISASKGRAKQMNAGAAAAEGSILLFLHADTILPVGWVEMIEKALENKNVAGGAFSFSTSGHSKGLKLVTFIVNLRSRVLSLPYGDQAIFIRREHFDAMEGFKEIPIMEDVDLITKMKKRGKLIILQAPVLTSSRRWEKEGWIKTTVRNQMLLFLYLLGIPPEKLFRFYNNIR